MSKLHGGFQVQQHKPWKVWIFLIIIAGLLVAAFVTGQTYQAYQLERVLLERETLLSRIADLENRNHHLVQQFYSNQGYRHSGRYHSPA